MKPERRVNAGQEREFGFHSSLLEALKAVSRGGTSSDLHFEKITLSAFGEGSGNPLQCSLPGESQGWRSLVGCRLWGRTELDMTDAT